MNKLTTTLVLVALAAPFGCRKEPAPAPAPAAAEPTTATTPGAPEAAFADGFESGDTSQWAAPDAASEASPPGATGPTAAAGQPTAEPASEPTPQ